MDGRLILRMERIDFLCEEHPDRALSRLAKCVAAIGNLEPRRKKSVGNLTKSSAVLVKNMGNLVKSPAILVKKQGHPHKKRGHPRKKQGQPHKKHGDPRKMRGRPRKKQGHSHAFPHNFVNSVNFVQTLSAYLVEESFKF